MKLEKQEKDTKQRLEEKDRELRNMIRMHNKEMDELRKRLKLMNGKAIPKIVKKELSYQKIYRGTKVDDDELGGIFKILAN